MKWLVPWRARGFRHYGLLRVICSGAATVAVAIVPVVATTSPATAGPRSWTPRASTPDGSGLYHPITPARIVDTRCSAVPQPSFCAGENLPSANAGLSTLTHFEKTLLAGSDAASAPRVDSTQILPNSTSSDSRPAVAGQVNRLLSVMPSR